MESHIIEFKELLAQFVENSQKRIGDYNSPEQQAILIEMLNLVKANPEARQDFVVCFNEIVNNPNCGMTWAVVVFCMRDLQWPEVKEAIERFLASNQEVSGGILRTMLDAYKKEYCFRGEFFYHDKREPPPPAKRGLLARLFGWIKR
jgi:hypothetical protein